MSPRATLANAQAGLQPKNLGGNTVTRQYDELGRLTVHLSVEPV